MAVDRLRVVIDPRNITEGKFGGMVIDASDCGLRPGEWPAQLLIEGRTWDRNRRIGEDGGWVYTNRDVRRELHVLND